MLTFDLTPQGLCWLPLCILRGEVLVWEAASAQRLPSAPGYRYGVRRLLGGSSKKRSLPGGKPWRVLSRCV